MKKENGNSDYHFLFFIELKFLHDIKSKDDIKTKGEKIYVKNVIIIK